MFMCILVMFLPLLSPEGLKCVISYLTSDHVHTDNDEEPS